MQLFFILYHTAGHGKGKKPIGEKLFLIKIENFYQKTTSLRRNPSHTPFERSEKQCVVRHSSMGQKTTNFTTS